MRHIQYAFVIFGTAMAVTTTAAFVTASAATGGVGPAPVAPLPPTPTPTSPPALRVPSVHLLAPHTFISEGTWLVDQSVNPPSATADVLSKCGAPGNRWGTSALANLKAGFTAEKAYFQERDAFGGPMPIGFVPETIDRVCVAYYVTVGHYSGDLASSAFFITARHRAGGPMYCITGSGGTLPAGAAGVSNAGGPILSPDQCAALPALVPTAGFSIEAMPRVFPLPSPNNALSAPMAPALSKAATPYALGVTNDLLTCTQHTGDQNTCEFDIINARAIMVWTQGTTCGNWPSCTTRIAGYRIYSVPRAQSRVTAPNATIRTVQPPPSSSGSVSMIVQPTPTPNIAMAPMPLAQRVLVATLTDSDHHGGIATVGAIDAFYLKPGKCFVVVAYLPKGDESDDSPQFCVAGPITVGPQQLDLTPSALETAYGHGTACNGVPPFAHPNGSIIAGYSVTPGTNDYPPGYRCHQYEGLVKFDLSGISPAVVYSAKLVYSKIQNYKLDGSADLSPGVCVQIIDDTTDDWASSVSDPRAGLVTPHNQLAESAGSSPYTIDVTGTVNAMLQGGVNNGFVVRTTDWNGPDSYCFTSFWDFHLIVTAFGNH